MRNGFGTELTLRFAFTEGYSTGRMDDTLSVMNVNQKHLFNTSFMQRYKETEREKSFNGTNDTQSRPEMG